jgi:hypothetical protein
MNSARDSGSDPVHGIRANLGQLLPQLLQRFLTAGAVVAAKADQALPDGLYNAERMLKRVASARHRLNISVLEGMNNRIKVIKRMAYGYRDSAYFFLKIRAAFPGKVR